MRGLCCLLVVLLLAGCAPAKMPAAADLSVAVPQGEVEQALRSAVAAYAASSGLHVRVMAFSPDGYSDHIAAVLLAGRAEVDLALLSGDALGHWANYHAIRALEVPAAPGLRPWLDALTLKGSLYGLPAQPQVTVLWYRSDLVPNAPLSWADFRAAALAASQPPQVYGAALAGSGLDAGAELSALFPGFGAAGLNDAGQLALERPEAVAALEFYAGLFSAERLALPGSANATRGAVLDALSQGRAALGIAPLSAARTLRDCAASPKACKAGQALLAWTWLPGLAQDEALGSLDAWVVPQHAAHAAAAAAFASWLATPAGARAWAQGGGTPLNAEVLQALGPEGAALARVERFHLGLPQAYLNEQMWAALHNAVHAAAAGVQSPAAALRSAAATISVLQLQGDDSFSTR
jgi:ABC-type glycerol-3-phosphate transport system substrate-binding protein